jgi:hypothetical protein
MPYNSAKAATTHEPRASFFLLIQLHYQLTGPRARAPNRLAPCLGLRAGAARGAVFYIYRNESRSKTKCCNPKNKKRDNIEKNVVYGTGTPYINIFIPIRLRNPKSGTNTTFLARNCGSVAPRSANSSCPLVVLASTNTCPRGSAP